jgi:hypothetical protein
MFALSAKEKSVFVIASASSFKCGGIVMMKWNTSLFGSRVYAGMSFNPAP